MIGLWKALLVCGVLASAGGATAALATDTTASKAASGAPQVFEEWLSVFNADDGTALAAFYARYHIDLPVGRDLDLRHRTGGFTVVQTEVAEPLRTVVLLKEKVRDTTVRVELSMSADTPATLTGISLRRVQAPLAPPVGSAPASVQSLSQSIDTSATKNHYSGVILVAHGDEIVVQKALGIADKATAARVTMDTRFHIGSMNKMFTAVAILQMVEAGQIKLDAPVGQYLKTYPNAAIATGVTVRQLLSHSGGTGDIFGPEFDAHRLQLKSLPDYVSLYGSRAPEFTPGSRFAYSNYGFILLGAIIEAVSGQTYYDYVDAHIYRPAGMTATGSLPETDHIAGLAMGYTGPDRQANTDTLPWRGTSAGGGYSTARDLLAFAKALRAGKLLSPDLLRQATTSQVSNDRGGYGFGFHPVGQGFEGYFGHGGGSPGMNGELRVYPRSDYIVIALSNLDPPAATEMVDLIATSLRP